MFQEQLIVDLDHLTFDQLDAYAQVFIHWAKDNPVLNKEDFAVAQEVHF